MRNYFNYDFENKAIIGSNAAIKRANKGSGNEYRELSRMLAEHPDFKVLPKVIDKKENKKKYTGLTFSRMSEYISTQPDSENKLLIFEKVMEIAEAKGSKYPLTKKWFLKTYPEYKENEADVIKANEQAKSQAEAEMADLLEKDEDMAA